jgi:hypothetical protein
MYFHKWSRLLLLIPLPFSVGSLTPTRAEMQYQTTDPAALIVWCPVAVTLPVRQRKEYIETPLMFHT